MKRRRWEPTRTLGVLPMDQVSELDLWWLWPGRIPTGNLTLLWEGSGCG